MVQRLPVLIVAPRLVLPETALTNGYVLEETDENAILRGIELLFPAVPDGTQMPAAELQLKLIQLGFVPFSALVLVNWLNLLTRGAHWKAVNYLSDWAIVFFRTSLADENVKCSFMRKQQRLIKTLTEGHDLLIYNYQAGCGKSTDDPFAAPWGYWNGEMPQDDIDSVAKIVNMEPGRKHSPSRDDEADETATGKRHKSE